jgi:hypothetical protein
LLYIINFYCVYMHCRWQVAAGTCLGVQEFIFEWKVSMWLNAAIFYDMSYIIFDESCHVCYTYVVLLYIINFYCVYMHCRWQVAAGTCLGVQEFIFEWKVSMWLNAAIFYDMSYIIILFLMYFVNVCAVCADNK